MPGKRRILPVAIGSLLIASGAEAAPKWDCRPGPDGGWECYKDGVLVVPEPVVSKTPPALKPQPKPEPAATPVEKPAPVEAVAAQPAVAPAGPEPAQVETIAVEPATPVRPAPEARPEPDTKPAPRPEPARIVREEAQPQATEKPVAQTPIPEKADTAAAQTEVATAAATPVPGIARIDQGLDWSQCNQKDGFDIAGPEMLTDDLTHVSAEGAELQRDEEVALFKGNVVVRQADQLIEADSVRFDSGNDTLDAEGNVFFEQPGLRVSGASARFHPDKDQGRIEKMEYRLLDKAARGGAELAEFENRDLSHFQQVSYTTCRPGNSDWILEAESMDIDRAEGVGTADGAKLSFKGVPLIYLPTITFPIDDRRKSGVLIPSIGYKSDNGLDVSVPYYFNIAPNMDATLTPRIMTDRGLMLGGEFRYLFEKHEGQLNAEIIPDDNQYEGDSSTRGALSYKAKGTPAQGWMFDVDINHVSDDDYLDDLGSSLAASSTKVQERRGDIRYYGNGWNFLGRIQDYQALEGASSDPYSRLPQLLLDLNKPDQAMGLTYHLRTEYVHFDRSNGVTGQRIDLQPGISLPIRRSWGYLTPKLSARYTSYDLEDQLPGLDDKPSRSLATLSIDGGLFFERDTSWFGSSAVQTLEPRLFYLYTPEENQDDLPIFDTDELDFSFANLFRENRFSGSDRVGDANQLTAALTTRYLSEQSGEELFRASFGQIIYFEDREVQLPGVSNADDDSSALVAEVAARLSDYWRVQAGIQWNPHNDDSETEKSAFSLQYRDGTDRIFNFAYRFTDELIEQADISARWPIGKQVHGVARWNYSLLHDQTMEAFAGIEFDSCCWTTRVIARQHRTDANTDPDTAIFFQLELKGLTSLGDKLDSFLEQGILGYESEK